MSKLDIKYNADPTIPKVCLYLASVPLWEMKSLKLSGWYHCILIFIDFSIETVPNEKNQ